MHTRTRTVIGTFVGALLLAASTASCGGGSGASCGVQPCGGDVAGNWRATSACADQASLDAAFMGAIADCPSATLTSVHYAPSGTLMFGSSMTYTADITMGMSFTMNMPASCLQGQTCADVNTALQSIVGTDGITVGHLLGQRIVHLRDRRDAGRRELRRDVRDRRHDADADGGQRRQRRQRPLLRAGIDAAPASPSTCRWRWRRSPSDIVLTKQ